MLKNLPENRKSQKDKGKIPGWVHPPDELGILIVHFFSLLPNLPEISEQPSTSKQTELRQKTDNLILHSTWY